MESTLLSSSSPRQQQQQQEEEATIAIRASEEHELTTVVSNENDTTNNTAKDPPSSSTTTTTTTTTNDSTTMTSTSSSILKPPTTSTTRELEERVEELETKLAVLSRLLRQSQQQQQPSIRTSSTSSNRNGQRKSLPSTSSTSSLLDMFTPPPATTTTTTTTTSRRSVTPPPQSVDKDDEDDDDTQTVQTSNAQTPSSNDNDLVSSPLDLKRNLSFKLLYNENEVDYQREHATVKTKQSNDESDDDGEIMNHTPTQQQQPSSQSNQRQVSLSNPESTPKRGALSFSHGRHRPSSSTTTTSTLMGGSHIIALSTNSVTPAEGQWLQPKLQDYLQYQKEQQQQDATCQEEPSGKDMTDDGNPKSSTQESTSTLQADTSNDNHNQSSPSSSQPLASQQQHCKNPTIQRRSRSISLSVNEEGRITNEHVRNNWLHYLNSFQETTPDHVDVQMQEFIKVPYAVESIMLYGLLICVDSFLYMITILPIRFVWSCFLLMLHLSSRIPIVAPLLWKPRPMVITTHHDPTTTTTTTTKEVQTRPRPPPPYRFHRRHSYQLIQLTIIYCICRFVLMAISIGKAYHWIRGQSMIKLYVLIAMVEVFDRLFSSLGQDCLDSLYWNTVNRPGSVRMVVSAVVVCVYAMIHTLLLFVHVETLNVAMNSADQALLTLLISGNFAEIKSTVFKKHNKPALFKITASDVCERFKLVLFLSLILLINVCQGIEQRQFLDFLRICLIVWCAELLSDWIKHSFITKFNFHPSRVYVEYSLLLAGDVTGIGHEGVNLDHSHAVVKRIGFAQIPLVCVAFRLLREAAKYATRNPSWQKMSTSLVPAPLWWAGGAPLFVAVWLWLFALKTALGKSLRRISLAKLRASPDVLESVSTKKSSIKVKKT